MHQAPADIALVTEPRFRHPVPGNAYVEHIFLEDERVADALASRGLRAVRESWSDPDVDWSQFRAIVLRTPWDYFERFEAFTRWLHEPPVAARIVNPLELLTWNMNKRYLADLRERGVRVVPTRFFEQGSRVCLEETLADAGWSEAVLKPMVSGAARHTYRLAPEDAARLQGTFEHLIGSEGMMLQPFMSDVIERGELSLMLFGGRYTHAVRKCAAPGDFRVQDDHGGVVHAHEAMPEEIEFARRAFEACGTRPVYGRVDVVRDEHGRLAVMELELVEPELWFRFDERAAGAFADALITYLGGA